MKIVELLNFRVKGISPTAYSGRNLGRILLIFL